MTVIATLTTEPRYIPSIHLLPEDGQFFITREPRPYTLPHYDAAEFPKRTQFESAHKTIADFVPIEGRLSMCPEAKALVEEFEPGIHQFFPVEITRRRSTRPIYRLDGRTLSTPYYMFFPQVMLDAVYIERSLVKTGPIMDETISAIPMSSRDLDKIVLHKDIISGHHLWRGQYQCHLQLFFSDALAKEIERRRLRKLNFVRVQEA